MPRLTPDDLARWRRVLYAGDPLNAATARRLMDEVDALRAELARQRVDIASKAAAALEKRLAAVAAYNSGGCPKCNDAEARAFLAKLKRIADDKGDAGAAWRAATHQPSMPPLTQVSPVLQKCRPASAGATSPIAREVSGSGVPSATRAADVEVRVPVNVKLIGYE